jgi:tetratricopeptide (TPR) repeat protein
LREELGQPPLSFKHLTAQEMAMELFKTLNTAAQPCLIILDQFEELLDPQTGKALTEQPGIGEWLDMLNSRPCASRVLLTSRFSLQGTRPYPPAYLQTYPVQALTVDEGVALLRKWGVQAKEAELRLAVERCQGHAQALLLLSGLLKRNPSVRIATLFNDSRYVHQRTNAMAELLNYIFTHQLNQDQRDLLRAFSVYREAVPLEAAQAIVEQRSPLTIERLMAALDVLLAQHLLQAAGDLRYHLHSLVAEFARDHFAEGGEQVNQQALRIAHAQAAQYYRRQAALTVLTRKQRRRIDDVHSLIEALYHHCRAGQQQDAYELMLQEGIFFDLQRWGGNSILLELYLHLLPSNTWQPAPVQAARIYNEIGEIYQVLGRERDAQRAYELALQGYRQLDDRGGIVNALDNLGSVYRRCGQIEEALACYEEAKLIGDEAEEDITGRGMTFNNLGYAYYALGKQSKSKELAGQRYQQALHYYQQALPLHRVAEDRSEEARTLNNLGQVYRALKQKAEAREAHQQALELAQEIGHRRIEADALNDLGIIYREEWNKEAALEYYGLALRIFREISARSEEANVLNNLGYLSFFKHQYDETLACFVLARDISNELQGSMQAELPKSVMTELRLELGEEQLKALLEEVEQRAEQIVEQILSG